MTRSDEIAAFLATTGYSGAVPEWLAGDASTRRYARVRAAGLPGAILMDAPPDEGDSNRAFHHMTLTLRAAGYSAPELLAADVPRGLMLLEDLGPDLYAAVLAEGRAGEAPLYAAAVDLLADLHRRPEAAAGLRPYDAAAYARETGLATEWYMRAITGAPAGRGEAAALDDAVLAAIDALPPRAPICVLRDYHAENLLWLPGREGHARVGLLDYQDALAGHPAYDLVSLIEDARRDTGPALQAAMRARYAEMSGTPLAEVEAAVAALGAQRNLKIVGIFARLCLRDRKPRYLSLIPRVWGHLMRDLAHPSLAPVAALVERILPEPTAARLAQVQAPA